VGLNLSNGIVSCPIIGFLRIMYDSGGMDELRARKLFERGSSPARAFDPSWYRCSKQ